MPTFGQIISLLSEVQKTCPDLQWSVTSNGILRIEGYVGIENYDLYKQGREMFAPTE